MLLYDSFHNQFHLDYYNYLIYHFLIPLRSTTRLIVFVFPLYNTLLRNAIYFEISKNFQRIHIFIAFFIFLLYNLLNESELILLNRLPYFVL